MKSLMQLIAVAGISLGSLSISTEASTPTSDNLAPEKSHTTSFDSFWGASPTSTNTSDIDTTKETPYVIGGQDAHYSDWSFTVSLNWNPSDPYSGHHCGGTLIRPNVVLTAAHCVDYTNAESLSVLTGMYSLNDTPLESFSIKQIITHEQWNSYSRSYDIALVILDGFSDADIAPLITVQNADALLPGSTVSVAGWGYNEIDTELLQPSILQEVDLALIDQAECSERAIATNTDIPISETMLCAATDPQSDKSACNGDSGGPLMMNIAGQRYQVGVVSWGSGTCHSDELPNIYTNIAYLSNWISYHADAQAYKYIKDYPVEDELLQRCIDQHAASNDLEYIFELEELYCPSLRVESLKGLSQYSKLKSLTIFDNPITDFSDLSELTKLEYLDISFTGFSNVSLLGSLYSLQYIALYGNEDITCVNINEPLSHEILVKNCIESTNNIKDLNLPDPKLKECALETAKTYDWETVDEVIWLECYDKNITNVAGINVFNNLEYLGLSNADITDASPITELPNLLSLQLGSNRNINLSTLSGLKDLQYLDINNCSISDFSPLLNMGEINFINASYNPSNNILSVLSTKQRLDGLSIAGSGISDFSDLAYFTNLDYLDISNNLIEDISVIENLTNLQSLYLADASITNIEPLRHLKQLVNLSLENNALKDISALETLTSLEYLVLSNNSISDLSPLRSLTSLQYLSLYINEVSDLGPLKNLLNLQNLLLDVNAIEDLSPLSNLTNLKSLSLLDNNIRDISPLQDLTLLDFISLGDNPIQCFDENPGTISYPLIPDSCFIPLDVDSDSDGIIDSEDNCPSKPNTNQRDTDNDGIGNRCDDDDDNDGFTDPEENRVGSDPLDPLSTPESILIDRDNDGILNDVDNCIDVKNWNQKDNDLDGEGDVCDYDDDNDGFIDAHENFIGSDPKNPLSTPENIDTDKDGDGIPNIWDNCIDKYNPNQEDFDKDRIGNKCDPDDDNDGFSDYQEKLLGTNPRNSNSYPVGYAFF